MKCKRCKKSVKGGKAAAIAMLRVALSKVAELGKSADGGEASYAYRFGALHAATQVAVARLEGFCGFCAELRSGEL